MTQIMEQVLSGRMQTETAALLLHATQITNGALKSRKSTHARRKPVRGATLRSLHTLRNSLGNAVENSALAILSDRLRRTVSFPQIIGPKDVSSKSGIAGVRMRHEFTPLLAKVDAGGQTVIRFMEGSVVGRDHHCVRLVILKRFL